MGRMPKSRSIKGLKAAPPHAVKSRVFAKALFLAADAVIFLLLLPISGAFAFEGPLSYKNQFPLFTHLASPRLEGASPEDSFAVTISHSSVYFYKVSPEWFFGLDMEVTEVLAAFRKKLGGSFEAGIEVPFISFSPGFMDGAVNGFHDLFGFPNYGRDWRPNNEFLYDVRRNGASVIRGEGGRFGLSDIRLSAKKAVFSGDTALSVKAEAELPSGDAKRGYGNGETDYSFALLFDKKIAERLKLYLNMGAVFPGDLKAMQDVGLRDYYFAGGALEWAYSQKLSLIAGLLAQTAPYPSTGVGAIDSTAMMLSGGGRYVKGADNLEFLFTEDPGASGSADFTFTFTYKRRF